MAHRWIDPYSGSERVSDDSPGADWLAIVTLTMPDGAEVDSTIPGIYGYLAGQDIGGSKSLDTIRNMIDMDFPDRPTYDNFTAGAICRTILACPYFVLSIEEEDEDGVLATLTMDPDADSLPPEDDTFQKMQRDTKLVRPGGGGGKPVPVGPPPVPWDPNLPFPGDPNREAPMPDLPDQLPDADELPDTGDLDLDQAARDQADEDADGVGVDPDKPGDIPHPDAKHPGDCDACGGTGQDPGDDGDGGDDQGDDDGAGGDEEDDLLKGFFDDEDDGDGDQESDDGGGSEGDQPGDSGAGDGDPGGEGEPGECQECNGTGEQQSDDGDEDDEGDDGDDDGDEDDEDEDDNLPELIDIANATIDEANAAIAAYSADASPEIIRGHIDKCMDLVDTCHKMAQSRSVLQRSILRKAVDAARRALDLEDKLKPVVIEVEGEIDE
jgi:hypothetical protein